VADAELAVAEARSAEAEAQSASTAAEAELAAARARKAAAAAVLADAEETRIGAAEASERAAGVLEATLAALERMLGPGEPDVLLTERQGAVQAAMADLDAARAAAAAAERRKAEADAAVAEGSRAVQDLVGRVAGLAARLDVPVEVSAEPDALEAAFGELRAAWVRRKQEADEALASAESEAAAVDQERAKLLSEAGLAPEADLRTAVGQAGAAHEASLRRVADVEARLARLAEMEAGEAETVAVRDRYARLADDLTRAKFPAYVLEDRRMMLADLGGDLFETLSAGRYRFSEDGEFDVIDLTAAEQVRSADSLSGGETFLASLALALALAEIVAREGGRLDAFFLDEGFGSLDPEHIGLAMDGVERLSAMGERLVVVVSHVEALRDRIEDLVVLDKDPLTGASRVVQGSSGPE
jgi:exonuclease SbcC